MEGHRKKSPSLEIRPRHPADAQAAPTSAPSTSVTQINVELADLMFDLGNEANSERLTGKLSAVESSKARDVLQEKRKASPTFIGILGKCAIPGCDVHSLTFAEQIINHYIEGQVIDPAFAAARALLRSADSATIGVIVYDSKLEILALDGTTRPA